MDREGKYTEVLIRWYDLLKRNEAPVIFGEGDQTMDFVFVEDVARANVLAMKSDTTNEVYNVACGVETSLKQLCEGLIVAMGARTAPRHVPIPPERKGGIEVRRRLADVSKAERLLGFRAAVPLAAGLRRLVAWLDGGGKAR